MRTIQLGQLGALEAKPTGEERGASGKQGFESLNVGIDPRRLRGPRLVVSGTDDRLIPPAIHRKLAARFGAEYREYPNRAHYIMREPGWEEVADDVMQWFEEARAGRT
jgi:pimeloyl-ACP methyl ester carboxylesterase